MLADVITWWIGNVIKGAIVMTIVIVGLAACIGYWTGSKASNDHIEVQETTTIETNATYKEFTNEKGSGWIIQDSLGKLIRHEFEFNEVE